MDKGDFLIMLIAAVGGLGSVITPILKLNSSIVRLNSLIESLNETSQILDKRITLHGKDIDDLKINIENHEIRISHLEQERK